MGMPHSLRHQPRKIIPKTAESTKIHSHSDFRIDFDAAPALIALAHSRPIHVMPDDLQSSPVPLAEISQGPNAFEQFLDRNQKNLIILSILIAIAVAALVIYRGVEKSRQETAGAALIKADNLTALQSVISEHTGTTAASSAAILLAERQWTEGQQDAAIESLRKFIAANPEHPALPTAHASLGSKLMIQGKSADAAKIFQDMIDDPKSRFVAPYALISLGDIAKLAGDLDKAEAAYNRVKTEFSDSSFAETAKRRSATLKAKPPVEIDPPPAPKTDPPTTPGTPGAPVMVPSTPGTPGAPVIVPGTPPTPPAPPVTPVTPVTPETPGAPVIVPGTPPTPPAPPVTPVTPVTPETPTTPTTPATPATPATPPAEATASEVPVGSPPQDPKPEPRSEPTGETPADSKP
jgi:predicted negative regulator of RcsB-dependent stress response